VKQVIKKIKHNRAPGPDNINAEMIKLGEPGVPALLDAYMKLYPEHGWQRNWPHSWKTALYVLY
jgi:hypothetical protein